MRSDLRFSLLIAISLACAALALGQNQGSAIDGLRAQLQNIQAQETELQEREKQFDEALKPENIERSLALTGSTKPEELREQRRRQLEREKAAVHTQLEQLAASRARLETAITTAENEAYRQSARPATATPQPPQTENIGQSGRAVRGETHPRNRQRHRRNRTSRRRAQ